MDTKDEFEKIEQVFTRLSETNMTLTAKYLDVYKGTLSTLDEFKHDVRSYIVLLHAALEDYIEGISLFTFDLAYSKFMNEGIISVPLMYALSTTGISQKHASVQKSENISRHIHRIYTSYIECRMEVVKKLSENNGINAKYLDKVLNAFGIYYDMCHVCLDSWEKVAKHRGMFAHADVNHVDMAQAIHEMSPEDAIKIGKDCLEFAKHVLGEAKLSVQADYKDMVSKIKDDQRSYKEKQAQEALAKKMSDEEKDRQDLILKQKKSDEKIANSQRAKYLTSQWEIVLEALKTKKELIKRVLGGVRNFV